MKPFVQIIIKTIKSQYKSSFSDKSKQLGLNKTPSENYSHNCTKLTLVVEWRVITKSGKTTLMPNLPQLIDLFVTQTLQKSLQVVVNETNEFLLQRTITVKIKYILFQ